ncbi:MAG TPA: hypothetical protein VEQ60_14960 [Longimicrobium sp.]|nr:hypothetical protein [Longimicrobium sp.]
MDRVLIDASTVLFISDLLEGREEPNAINLLNLASFVESVILHKHITVLRMGTGGDAGQRLDVFAAQLPDGIMRVLHKEPFSLLEEWRTLRSREARNVPQMWSDLFLDLDRADEELRAYVGTLQDISNHYWGSGDQRPGAPESAQTASLYESTPALSTSMARFVRREKLLPDTVFNEWYLHGEGRRFGRFAEGSIVRAQMYLCAAEVLDAPYKPDALRWPLCWKLLTRSSLSPVRDEALVELALKEEIAAAEQVRKVFGAGSLAVGLPLFLRTVLRLSSAPADVLRTALEIRYSKEAERFRDFCQRMREAVAAEELQKSLRGLSDYSSALKKVFGDSGTPGAMWTLVEGGTALTTAAIGGTPAAFLALAPKAKGPLSELSGWWRRRRFALITRALKTAKQADAFRSEVKRVFGRVLPDSELRMLTRISRAE